MKLPDTPQPLDAQIEVSHPLFPSFVEKWNRAHDIGTVSTLALMIVEFIEFPPDNDMTLEISNYASDQGFKPNLEEHPTYPQQFEIVPSLFANLAQAARNRRTSLFVATNRAILAYDLRRQTGSYPLPRLT